MKSFYKKLKKHRSEILQVALFVLYTFAFIYLIFFLLAGNGQHLSSKELIVIVLYGSFLFGSFACIKNLIRTRQYFKHIGSFRMSIARLKTLAKRAHTELPRIAIFVPARNEGYVIGNTLRRLEKLDYPKSRYRIVIIVDERELDDNVEVLTKKVVREVAREIEKKHGEHFITCVEVPKWYSGVFGSTKKTHEKSTKGRALNYTLQQASALGFADFDMVGVLDADGRLDVGVLKEVAYNRITAQSKLLQGPVFQVSNFNQVSIIGVAAGLELATHHLTELSHHLNRNEFHFLAGTNYFIEQNLIVECGGWDQHALVEDAELALRLYVQKRVTATWLDSPELEQTPPNFAVYTKQRERWVRGHFSLVSIVLQSAVSVREKYAFLWKVFTAQFRFFLDIGFPLVALVLIITNRLPGLDLFLTCISVMLFVSSIIVLNMYGYMYMKLKAFIPHSPRTKYRYVEPFKLFCFAPVMLLVQIVPRMQALYRFIFNLNTGGWYKTERTKELVTE